MSLYYLEGDKIQRKETTRLPNSKVEALRDGNAEGKHYTFLVHRKKDSILS